MLCRLPKNKTANEYGWVWPPSLWLGRHGQRSSRSSSSRSRPQSAQPRPGPSPVDIALLRPLWSLWYLSPAPSPISMAIFDSILVWETVLALFLVYAHAEICQRVACHRNPISISIWLLSLRHVAQCLGKLAKKYIINCKIRICFFFLFFLAIWQSTARSRQPPEQALVFWHLCPPLICSPPLAIASS